LDPLLNRASFHSVTLNPTASLKRHRPARQRVLYRQAHCTIALAFSLIFPLLASSPTQGAEREAEVRAIWVTRWDYKTPADVQQIVSNCAAMRFNVILFQVRGNGTVFYPSGMEPWAWELTSEGPETTGRDPGWDPLKLAIAEAHRHGMELHAYVNVFPAWRSQKFPPRDSGQLWWEHPDWFMCDAAGNRMIPRDADLDEGVTRDWYSFLSPGVPEVQDSRARSGKWRRATRSVGRSSATGRTTR
jgi:uncharacterized lipoprotein YddW (UPF0748 family)